MVIPLSPRYARRTHASLDPIYCPPVHRTSSAKVSQRRKLTSVPIAAVASEEVGRDTVLHFEELRHVSTIAAPHPLRHVTGALPGQFRGATQGASRCHSPKHILTITDDVG